MSKEYLEAFNRIALHTEYDNNSAYDCLKFENDCKLVEQALQRLDQIENSNPSEALEDFKIIKFKTINAGYDYGYKVWDKIEQALIKAQEQEKVLEIIKEKGYDDYLLEEFDIFEAYKKNMDKFYANQLVIDWNDKKQLVELRIYNEEEFDLLKRWS